MAFKIQDTPEEMLRQGQQGFEQVIRWLPAGLIAISFLAIILSSFYSVGPDEVGVLRL